MNDLDRLRTYPQLDIRGSVARKQDHILTDLKIDEALAAWANPDTKDRAKKLILKLHLIKKDPTRNFTQEDRNLIIESRNTIQQNRQKLEEQIVELELQSSPNQPDPAVLEPLQTQLTELEAFSGFLNLVEANLFPDELRAEATEASYKEILNQGHALSDQINAEVEQLNRQISAFASSPSTVPFLDFSTLDSLISSSHDLEAVMSTSGGAVDPAEQKVLQKLSAGRTAAQKTHEFYERVRNSIIDNKVETYYSSVIPDIEAFEDDLITVAASADVPTKDAERVRLEAEVERLSLANTEAEIDPAVKSKETVLLKRINDAYKNRKTDLENQENQLAAADLERKKADAIKLVKETVKDVQSLREITEIDELRPDINYAFMRDTYLNPLKKAGDSARAASLDPQAIDQSFNELLNLAQEISERIQYQEMDFPSIIEIATKYTNQELFMPSADVDKIPNKKDRAFVKRFQALYFRGSTSIDARNFLDYIPEKIAAGEVDQDILQMSAADLEVIDDTNFWIYLPAQKGNPATPKLIADATRRKQELIEEAEIRHRQLKTRVVAYRYFDRHTPDYVPASGQSDVDDTFLRRVGHDDIIDGVTFHPEYGKASRKILEYCRDLIAGEVGDIITAGDPIPANRKTAKQIGLHYDSLVSNQDGPELFKAHLNKAAIDLGLFGTISQEHLDITWLLFIVLDGPGDALAKLQKGMKTRSHNHDKEKKLDYYNWFALVESHLRNRYGPLNHGGQYLYTVTGKFPIGSVGNVKWSGNESEVEVLDEHGIGTGKIVHTWTQRESQELIVQYQEMYYGLDGVKNMVLPDDQGPEAWNRSTFPTNLEYAMNPLSSGDPAPADLFLSARAAWQNVVDLILEPISGPLDESSIFGSTGYLTRFIGSTGLGGAKMVKKMNPETGKREYCHYDWFIPLLGYFIARLGRLYEKDDFASRIAFTENIIRALNDATTPLKGLDLAGYDTDTFKQLQNFISMLHHGKNRLGSNWKGVPELLVPRMDPGLLSSYREERIRFAVNWFKIATRSPDTGISQPTPWIPPIGQSVAQSAQTAVNSKLKEEYHLFYKIISGDISEHDEDAILRFVASRKELNMDTSKGSAPKK